MEQRESLWVIVLTTFIELLNILPSRAGMLVIGWGIACGNCPKTAG